MKKHFTYNFVEKTIIGSKASINKANKGMNPEYNELTAMLSAHPDFSVEVKDIKRKEGRKSYNGLTFDRMKEYISLQVDSEAKLIEFEAIIKVASAKGAKYPLTKRWFLATYKEYKEANITVNEAETAQTDVEAA